VIFLAENKRRVALIIGFFVIAGLFLTAKLWEIQVLKHEPLQAMAQSQQVSNIAGELYPRGTINDRYGRDLTDTTARPAAVLFPGEERDAQELAATLAPLVDLSAEQILTRMNQSRPAVITDLTPAQAAALKALKMPEVQVLSIISPLGPASLARHLIGGLNSGGGTSGLEAQFNQELTAPFPSHTWTVVKDALGRPLPGSYSINQAPDQNRNNLILTIDRDLQLHVEKVMDRMVERGAVVVQDVASGDILALASRPNFDPWRQDQAQATALTNRALSLYYPGSVFKILVAAAALEEGLVEPDTVFNCAGQYLFDGGMAINCWQEGGHGELTLTEALANSCNVAFVEIGQKLGRERLLAYAAAMGLDQAEITGYDLGGLPPSLAVDYGAPALGNASVGQLGVRLTPVQVNNLMTTIARGGLYRNPRLTLAVRSAAGENSAEFPLAEARRVISPATARQLQNMLAETTLSGTGQKAWIKGGSAGKTGTAESGMQEAGRPVAYAWFTGYAPLDEPRYAVTVLVEGQGGGGDTAAPVFKAVLEGFFEDDG